MIHHVGIVSTRFVLVFDLDQARIDIYKEITIRDGNDPDQCRCLTLFDAFQLVQAEHCGIVAMLFSIFLISQKNVDFFEISSYLLKRVQGDNFKMGCAETHILKGVQK